MDPLDVAHDPVDPIDPADLAGFLTRRFRCYRCGTHGGETRAVATRHGPDVIVLRDATVLLACCPDCAPAALSRQRVDDGAALARDVRYGLVPGAVRTDQLICPLPSCGTPRWPRTRPVLPWGRVYDPYRDQVSHPCPWCVTDDPVRAADTHRRTREVALRDLRTWESELADSRS